MRFKVYVSPKDGESLLGYVEPYGVIHGNQCTWLQTPFGVPVAMRARLNWPRAPAYRCF